MGGPTEQPAGAPVVLHTDPGAAFDALYRREHAPLVRLAWTLTGRRDVAEELVQDVMLRIHGDWGRVHAYDAPGAYARRLLLHDALSANRRRDAEERALRRLPALVEHRDDPPPDDAIWSALRSLPERQAQVLVLHYLEDRAVADIAAVLEIAEGTVKVHLHRGRLAMAELLRDELEEGR